MADAAWRSLYILAAYLSNGDTHTEPRRVIGGVLFCNLVKSRVRSPDRTIIRQSCFFIVAFF